MGCDPAAVSTTLLYAVLRRGGRFAMVRKCAAIAVLIASATLLAGCGPKYSTLVVHNRTTAPISFVNIRGETLYLPECSSETFTWTGAWTADSPGSPIPAALEVRIDAAPPADSSGTTYVAVVTSGGIAHVEADAAASLPPCDGVPPTYLTLDVYNWTAAPIRFESRGVAHYVEACRSGHYEWSEGEGWTNGPWRETPITDSAEVRIDVTPPPSERVGAMYFLITPDEASVVETQPHPWPSPCTGAPPSPR
jgi:hypothetical protein